MSSLNRAILLGNLGKDPELRATQDGAQVCNFPIATTEKFKDSMGNIKEKTEWHKIVVWGKQAEICKQYLAKGRSVLIEGKIQTRQWEDDSGQKRYSTEIRAENVRFVGGSRSEKSDQTPIAPEIEVFSETNFDSIPF
jgi:single-strand DNA-binding protein